MNNNKFKRDLPQMYRFRLSPTKTSSSREIQNELVPIYGPSKHLVLQPQLVILLKIHGQLALATENTADVTVRPFVVHGFTVTLSSTVVPIDGDLQQVLCDNDVRVGVTRRTFARPVVDQVVPDAAVNRVHQLHVRSLPLLSQVPHLNLQQFEEVQLQGGVADVQRALHETGRVKYHELLKEDVKLDSSERNSRDRRYFDAARLSFNQLHQYPDDVDQREQVPVRRER